MARRPAAASGARAARTARSEKAGGRAVSERRRWADLLTPEDRKGWQALAAVAGVPLRYKVDLNSGDIFRVDCDGKPSKLMSTCLMDKKNPDGSYRQISLTFPGSKQKTFYVHALVCYTAHGVRPDGCTSVDHLDRRPSNNAAINLAWASAKQQAANQRPGGRKAMLPFVPQPGEVLYRYLGSPGFVYTGPRLEFTSLGRIVRNGMLSQATSVEGGGYPVIKVHGQGVKKVHRIAWSAFKGPDAPLPDLINHINHDKLDFSVGNLEASDSSHNATAAHDSGAYNGGKTERQAVRIFDDCSGEGEPWLYDGVHPAVFGSQHSAAKALGAYQGNICSSIQKNCAFTATVGGQKTKLWAFRAAHDPDTAEPVPDPPAAP